MQNKVRGFRHLFTVLPPLDGVPEVVHIGDGVGAEHRVKYWRDLSSFRGVAFETARTEPVEARLTQFVAILKGL